MFFTIKNKKYISAEQLRTDTLLNAYFVIQHFPMKASDIALNNFLQTSYNTNLKNLCIKLILSLTFHRDKDNNLILLFKNPKDDLMARLITYGNGAVPGSKILQIAFDH